MSRIGGPTPSERELAKRLRDLETLTMPELRSLLMYLDDRANRTRADRKRYDRQELISAVVEHWETAINGGQADG